MRIPGNASIIRAAEKSMDPLGHSDAAVIDKHYDKECGAAVSAGTAIICAV